MNRWSNAHTVACLWLLVGVLLVGWLAGLVSVALNAQNQSYTVDPAPAAPKRVYRYAP